MVSKFIMRSILALSLVLFMGTTAGATISGTSTTQTKCTTTNHLLGLCSIAVDGILTKLGNETKNPSAFIVNILIEDGTFFCKNPAGNSIEGNGVPFRGIAVPLENADAVNAADVQHNGRYLADIPFHDAELIGAIVTAECGADQTQWPTCPFFQSIQCQHSNWIQTIVITKLQVLGEQFTDPASTEPNTCDLNSDPLIIDNTCTPTDALGTNCIAPQAVLDNPKSFVWKAFTYKDVDVLGNPSTNDCGTTPVCHNATGTTCPAELPL